jgi:hypothetical protein
MSDAMNHRKRPLLFLTLAAVLLVVLSYALKIGFFWALIVIYAWPAYSIAITGFDLSPVDQVNWNGKLKPYLILFGALVLLVLLLSLAVSFPEMAHYGVRDLLALM